MNLPNHCGSVADDKPTGTRIPISLLWRRPAVGEFPISLLSLGNDVYVVWSNHSALKVHGVSTTMWSWFIDVRMMHK